MSRQRHGRQQMEVVGTAARVVLTSQPTTKKCKNKKTKKWKTGMLRNNSKQSGESIYETRRRKKEGQQWEGFTEKEGFKPRM